MSSQKTLSLCKIDNLNTNIVYCTFQDSKGYVWIGTDVGVFRHDGYDVTAFTRDEGLSDNEVFQIHEDRKGRIWFLTYNGEPSVYDKGKILTTKNCSFLSNIKPGVLAVDFLQQGDSIWYITKNTAYLFCNDILRKTLLSSKLFNDSSASFIDGEFCNSSKAIASNMGIYFLNDSILFFKKPSALRYVTKLVSLGNNIFFKTQNILWNYQLNSQIIDPVQDFSSKVFNNFFLSSEDSSIEIITNKGFFKYFPKSDSVALTHRVNVQYATDKLFDKEGNLWIATYANGLQFHSNTIIEKITQDGINNNQAVYALALDNGKIYAGMTDGEFLVWTNGYLKKIPSLSNNESNKVYSINRINKQLLAASNVVYDIEKKVSQKYLTGSVKALASSNNYVYVCFGNAVCKVSKDSFNSSLQKRNDKEWNYVYKKRVNCILTKGYDTLYLAGLDGLKMLVNNKIVSANFNELEVANTTITKIVDNDKVGIVFSTSGKGIGLLNGVNCYNLSKKEGLLSDVCNSLFVQNKNTLWVATNKGLSRVVYSIINSKINANITNYTKAEGLPSDNINDVVVSNDTVWVATEKGLCRFNANQQLNQFPPPNLVIESILVNGKFSEVVTNIQLPYSSNNIAINYTGISFYSKGNIKYEYKLNGVEDTQWHQTAARHIEFANLASGQYTLLIKAANANGLFCEPIKICIKILPPFWRTWWFISCFSLLTICIALLIVKTFISNLKHKHTVQTQQLNFERKLAELEHKALRLQMNPHFIFNAINAIKGYYATNNTKEAKNYIDTFSSLMRLMLETGNDNSIKLIDEIAILNNYLKLSALRYDNRFTYLIETTEALKSQQINIPILLIQPFVENAVLHGIASIKVGGTIKIVFEQKENMLFCSIEDNGIGRRKAAELSSRRMHISRGIEITEQRLKFLSQNSQLVIIDKTDNFGNSLGTLVQLLIPIINSEFI